MNHFVDITKKVLLLLLVACGGGASAHTGEQLPDHGPYSGVYLQFSHQVADAEAIAEEVENIFQRAGLHPQIVADHGAPWDVVTQSPQVKLGGYSTAYIGPEPADWGYNGCYHQRGYSLASTTYPTHSVWNTADLIVHEILHSCGLDHLYGEDSVGNIMSVFPGEVPPGTPRINQWQADIAAYCLG